MKKLIIVIILVILGYGVYNYMKSREKTVSEAVRTGQEVLDIPTMKAKQTEAQNHLVLIANKQHEYYAKNGRFTSSMDSLQSFNQTGLKEQGYYKYSIRIATDNTFIIRATGNLDRDPDEDIWEMNQDGNLIHIRNDI